MITIYVWGSNIQNLDPFGHVAMEIQTYSRKEYISWYPATNNHAKLGEITGVAHAPFFTSYESEVSNTKKHAEEPPTVLYQFNENVMLEFWDKMHPRINYKLLETNCAFVVTTLLFLGWIGTLDEYAGEITHELIDKAFDKLEAKAADPNVQATINQMRHKFPVTQSGTIYASIIAMIVATFTLELPFFVSAVVSIATGYFFERRLLSKGVIRPDDVVALAKFFEYMERQ